MCNFFSLCSRGDGKPMYFDWPLRKKCINRELDYNPDSHTSIADYFGFVGESEDKLNKFEFNPLTKKFLVNQLNTFDDRDAIERFCMTVDFKTIVPVLIIKSIVNPFNLVMVKRPTETDIENIKKWASVWDLVWASIWTPVGATVRDSIWASIWALLSDSISGPVRDSA